MSTPIIDFPPIVVRPDPIEFPPFPPNQNPVPGPFLPDNSGSTGFKGPFNGGGSTILIDPRGPVPTRSEALLGFTPNGYEVWKAAAAGNSLGMLSNFCNGLIGQTPAMGLVACSAWGNFYLRQMNGEYLPEGVQPGALNIPIASLPQLPNLASSYILAGLYGSAFTPAKKTTDHDFWGTPMMPIAGMAFWVTGKGQDRTVDVRSLGLKLGINDLAPVLSIIQDPNNSAGAYPIKAPFTYNSFNQGISGLWAAGLVGRVSGEIKGILNIRDDGSWAFNGSFRLNPDFYDADPSNRPGMQEDLTNALRFIGETLGHDDYWIKFENSQDVNLSGQR